MLDATLWVQVPELARYLAHVLVWAADDHLIPCLSKGLGHDAHGVVCFKASQSDHLVGGSQGLLGPDIATGLLPVPVALVGRINELPEVLAVREEEEQERLPVVGALEEDMDPFQVPADVLDDIRESGLDKDHILSEVDLILCCGTGPVDDEITVDKSNEGE